jgi:glycine hydroxymethyltransferase|tara:strand:+ start:51 stop:1190 length:1140 start_codon:yes stop_codon:yes gene_type:complete
MNEEIRYILTKEHGRQQDTVELIASENFASEAVMELCGSVFTNKYAEGYPGKRYYNGCENMDLIEQLAIDKLCELYNCKFANVQPHSGVNANTAVYQALMKPGDTLMGMDLASGGHLSHGAPPTLSGKVYNAVTYGVDENGLLNYEQIRSLAKISRPNVIIAGASAYPRQIDWSAFKDIADGIGAYLVVDMAHYSGLIAGNAYDSPLPYADVVTSTTHKTLRGPRGGMILWNNPDYTKKINSSIFPGTQGGPLMNIIAAKAQCYIEALDPSFKVYADQIVKNARAMCNVFEQRGFPVQTGGTDSHIILMDLSTSKHSGRQAADLLEENGITVNKNGVPNDPRNFVETSGIRIGTSAETTRGLIETDFERIAHKICELLK